MSTPKSPPTSDSWCLTEVKVRKVSFQWTITNFRFCREHTGQCLESLTFPVAGNEKKKWRLLCYPRGESNGYSDYVSLFLKLDASDTPSVDVAYHFSILDARGEAKEQAGKQNTPIKLDQGGKSGFPRFILRKMLFNEPNGLLPDDRLTIYCEVNVVEDYVSTSGRTTTPDLSARVPGSRLSEDLGRLLEDQKHGDVAVASADGRCYVAHRAVLASRSPVFAAMFDHDTKERKHGSVEITDLEPRVLAEMLHYIYTDSASGMDEDLAKGLFEAADKYSLDGLKAMCEEYMRSNLSVDGAAAVLAMAEARAADQLKADVVKFIVENAEDVMDSKGWEELVSGRPRVVAEVLLTPGTPQSFFRMLDDKFPSFFGKNENE